MGKTILTPHQHHFLERASDEPSITKRFYLTGGTALAVDSVYDIAVNKVHTLFMKPRARDYIDLYFIMKREAHDLTKLVGDAKAKFDWHIDPPTLGSQLMRVTDFAQRELPTMLVPFDRREMEEFFLKLAAGLKAEILTE